MLVERCFKALDHDRIEFHDTTGRCSVASTAAATMGLGICLLAAPEILVGTVVIAGVVVMGILIKEALDEHGCSSKPSDSLLPSTSHPAPSLD